MTRRVLIVDDDAGIRSTLADALAAAGMQVTVAESGAQALARIGTDAPDVRDVRRLRPSVSLPRPCRMKSGMA